MTAATSAVCGTAVAAPLAGTFSGSAHAVAVNVGVSTAAPLTFNSAEEGCPCKGTNGAIRSTTSMSVEIGPLGAIATAGDNAASAVGTKTATTASTTEASTVSKLNLFGGLITADAITVKASAGATPNTLTTSDSGTILTKLVIAGQAIDPDVAENTQVDLPDLGSVTVKLVNVTSTTQDATINVNGLLVTVSKKNSFGVPVGTRIIVGDATAGYSRVQPAVLLGGYGASSRVSGEASDALKGAIGLGAGISLRSCTGSGGVTHKREADVLNLPGLATAADEEATVFGGPVGDATVSKSTATVSNVSALGGLITAKTIAAVAQESRVGNVSTASTAGSGFTDLMVAGVAVPTDTKPNTQLILPGVGYVVVNGQVTTSPAYGQVTVTGLEIVVTKTNLLGLTVGTHLTLARAGALAQKY